MTHDEKKALAELFTKCGMQPPYPTADEMELIVRWGLALSAERDAFTLKNDTLRNAWETQEKDHQALLERFAALSVQWEEAQAEKKHQRSCQCPAGQGEACPLTIEECQARSRDYVGLPWFGARLRRVFDGFVRESLNGVVCSIPDGGLETPAHRTWCVRCQARYIELKALVEMLEATGKPVEASPGEIVKTDPAAARTLLRTWLQEDQAGEIVKSCPKCGAHQGQRKTEDRPTPWWCSYCDNEYDEPVVYRRVGGPQG